MPETRVYKSHVNRKVKLIFGLTITQAGFALLLCLPVCAFALFKWVIFPEATVVCIVAVLVSYGFVRFSANNRSARQLVGDILHYMRQPKQLVWTVKKGLTALQKVVRVELIAHDAVKLRFSRKWVRVIVITEFINFPQLPPQRQREVIAGYEILLNSLGTTAIQLVNRTRRLSLQDYINWMKEINARETIRFLKIYREEYIRHVEYLAQTRDLLDTEGFVVISAIEPGKPGWLKRFIAARFKGESLEDLDTESMVIQELDTQTELLLPLIVGAGSEGRVVRSDELGSLHHSFWTNKSWTANSRSITTPRPIAIRARESGPNPEQKALPEAEQVQETSLVKAF